MSQCYWHLPFVFSQKLTVKGKAVKKERFSKDALEIMSEMLKTQGDANTCTSLFYTFSA